MTFEMLDTASWKQIESYLDQAFDLQESQRDAWLAELSVAEPALARALRELLDEHAELNAAGFLEDPAVKRSTP